MRKGHWMPPEGYALVGEERPGQLSIRRVIVIRAECTHGEHERGGQLFHQEVLIALPRWWGEAHKIEAIRQLQFFVPGQAPESRLLA